MSEVTHTPGPWRVRATRGAEGKPKTVWVQHGDIGTIAQIYCGIRILDNPKKEEVDAIKEANARLIAAAPALLAAAKKTKAFIDDLARGNPGFLGRLVLQDYQQYNEAMMELPAAILLAEGKH